MSEPPQKRRRLMSGPDGFDLEPVKKQTAPKFESPFKLDAPFTPKKVATIKPLYNFQTRSPVQQTPKLKQLLPPAVKLKQLVPPALPVTPNRSNVTLKPLAPPVFKSESSPRNLQAISSIPVPTDIDTGLTSDFSTEDDVDRKVKRGVNISPQKPGAKVGQRAFFRNGLAAQAAQVMNRRQTSHSLWMKDTARALSSSKATPDLRFTILKVIHTPVPSSSTDSIPGLALCVQYTSPSLIPSPSFPFPPKEDRCLLLLSFASPPSGSPVCNPTRFTEGKQVWVWKPWHSTAASIPDIDSVERLFVSNRFAIID